MAGISISLTWQGDVQLVGDALEQAQSAIQRKLADAATQIAQLLERDAKASARWTDRTGAARAGLVAWTDVAQDVITIWLAHGVDYGRYLELAHGGRYATIMPTIERNTPAIRAILEGVLR